MTPGSVFRRRGRLGVPRRRRLPPRDGQASTGRCSRASPPRRRPRPRSTRRSGSRRAARSSRGPRSGVGEYLEEWLEPSRGRLRATTIHGYRCRDSQHQAGPRSVPVAVADAVADRALLRRPARQRSASGGGALSAKSVRNVHVVLRKALADAERLGLVLRNAAAARPTANRTASGVRDMVVGRPASVPGVGGGPSTVRRCTCCWRRPGYATARCSGCAGRDVDFDGSQLAVSHTLTQCRRRAGDRARPRRLVAAATSTWIRRTVSVLREHRKRQQRGTARDRPGWDGPRSTSSSPTSSAEPVHPDVVSREFLRIVRSLDVPRIRLHDLRHTHATLALKAGVHPKVGVRAARPRDGRHHARPLLACRAVDRTRCCEYRRPPHLRSRGMNGTRAWPERSDRAPHRQGWMDVPAPGGRPAVILVV